MVRTRSDSLWFNTFVCSHHNFGNNFVIEHKLVKYLKKSCWISYDKQFFFKCFQKYALIRKIYSKLSVSMSNLVVNVLKEGHRGV